MIHTLAVLISFLWRIDAVLAETDEVNSVSVMEGDSVTLHTHVSVIQEDDMIMWMCGDSCIAKLNVSSHAVSEGNERLSGRMELDLKTGSLTIRNISIMDSGVYKAQIIGNKVARKTFNVTVIARLHVPIVTSYCTQNPPSSDNPSVSKCVVLCSVCNVSHVSLSWYKGMSLLSSISVSDLNVRLSLPLEVEYQDPDTYTCVVSNPVSNQTQHLHITHVCQTCSDCVCCRGSTEAVIQLVVSVLVGVATVVVLAYDMMSRRGEQKREQTSTSVRHP